MRRCAFEGKTVDTSQGNVKRTPATIAAPSAPAGHQHQGIHRGIEMGRSKYTFLYHSARNRKFADSSPEGGGFEISVPCYRRWSCRSPRYAIRAEQPSVGEITPPWAPIVCLPALNHALIVMGWHVEMHEV